MTSRAVATTFGYVLTLAITTLLVSGLLIAGGNFVEDQREHVIESELEVIGEQLANQVNAADRLVQSGQGETTVRIEQRFPVTVTDVPYRITLHEEERAFIQLNSTRHDVSTTVSVSNTTDVGHSRADGGSIVIEYEEEEETVVIDNV